MADEIRTEDVVVTEELELTDDVNEGLGWKDYAIVGGIMAAGAVAYEGGKKVYHLTKEKAIPWIKDKFSKKKSDGEEPQEHEADEKPAKTNSKGTKTDDKKSEK